MLKKTKNTTILAGATLLAVLIALAVSMFSGKPVAAQAVFLKWDIVFVDTSGAPGTIIANPGGKASVTAGDIVDAGPSITLTGTGTFVAPGGGRSNAVTGGGEWETFDADGNSTAVGTYEVTSLVSWHPAQGTLPAPPFIDNNGSIADATAGLAIMTIEYSDGSEGVLTVSCQLPTTPPEEAATIQEGITVTKGFVEYWDREDATPGVDGDGVTVFHYVRHP